MRRYLVLIASIIIQAGLGGIYAWSAFAAPLHEHFGLSMARIQAVFGVCIAAFTLMMIFAGRLQDRFGPRWISALGGLLFGGGYFAASFSGGRFVPLFLGCGVIAGAGIGFAYVCPIASCIRWFPERKGMAAGFAVAGFGGGAIVLSYIADILFARGWEVLSIFRWIGIVDGALIVIASMLLSIPKKSSTIMQTDIPYYLLLRHPKIWMLSLGLFAGTFSGLMTVSNLKLIGLAGGVSQSLAALSISSFAIGNASGRIIWGLIADRIKEKSIPLLLGLLSIFMFSMIPLSHFGWPFVILASLIGFGFGGNFVIYAAAAANRFGENSVGRIYPLVFLSYGLSGPLGPTTGGWIYDATASYAYALLIASLLAGGAAVAFAVYMRRE
ncbi:MAG: MFS transporter [Candidatus Omnitrophota bacterium]